VNGLPPINKQPNGLLGFLGIKNGGRSPDALIPGLSVSWDVHQLYLAQDALYDVQSGTITATGGTSVWTVPAGEVWFVLAMGVRVTPTINESCSITCCAISPPATATIFVPVGPQCKSRYENTAPTVDSGAFAHADRTFAMRAGDGLGFTVDEYTDAGGGLDYNAYLRYVRMIA
jgi:hypothetical protein